MALVKHPTYEYCTTTMNDAEIVVGSETELDARIKLSRWDSEAWIQLLPEFLEDADEAEFEDEKVKIKKDDIEFECWQLNASVLEYSIKYDSLTDLPGDHIIRLTITDSGNLSYLFQDEDASRPDNVKGSYAVYVNKQNNQYKTGKVCNLFSWEIVDALDEHRACESLVIDGDELLIELPDLTGLTFPITAIGLGDTLGTQSEGGTTDTLWDDRRHDFYIGTAGSAGTVTSVSFYNDSASTSTARFAVYDLTDSKSRVCYTEEGSLVANDWTTLDVAVSDADIISGHEYYAMAWCDSPDAGYAYDADNDFDNVYLQDTYDGDPPPDPSNTSYAISNRKVSIYITYGGAETVTLAGVDAFNFSGKSLFLNETFILGSLSFTYAGKELSTGTVVTFIKQAFTFTGLPAFTNVIFHLVKQALTFTGQSFLSNAAVVFNLVKGTLAWTGKILLLNETFHLVAVAFTWTGKNLTVIGGSIVTLTKTSLSFAGKTLYLNESFLLVKGALLFGGKSVISTVSELASKGLSKLGLSTRME